MVGGGGLVVPYTCRHSILLDVAFCQSDGCEIASLWFKLALYSSLARLNISCVYRDTMFLIHDQCWLPLNTGHGMAEGKVGETKAKVRDSWGRDMKMFLGVGHRQRGGGRRQWRCPECSVASSFGIRFCAGWAHFKPHSGASPCFE